MVRKLIGYDRYESRAALDALKAVYAVLRLWTNHWQPVLKLVSKERSGARVTKRYDTAQTPYRRVLAASLLPAEAEQALRDAHAARGPVAVRAALDQAVAAFWRHHVRGHQPHQPVEDLPWAAGE